MSEIKLFNSMSRSIEAFKPRDGNAVGMYCCGLTVYAQGHIGNFRTFLFQDVLRRTLQVAGYKARHVRNLTDVDDKTIATAVRENKPLKEVTEHWTEIFHKDCERLNLLPPTIEPKATDHIQDQIDMIQRLIDKDHAYRTDDGSVYFRVSSFDEYGRLSRVKERELTTTDADASPVDNDEYERDSLADFALWKSRKEADGDIYWDSPWGQGRPGWHIECSAMAMKYLGRNLDIHSGGVDLTFPHHENEIAQSECACNVEFFRYWIHGAFLMVEGQKMSKSLGNLFTVDDIAEKGFTPTALRYALTSGHYRQTINFTMDSLHAAESALQRLRKFSDAILAASGQKRGDLLKAISKGKRSRDPWDAFEGAWNKLCHDLNVPAALGALFGTLNQLKPEQLDPDQAAKASIAFHKLIFALGYDLEQVVVEKPKVDAPEDIKALARQRWDAKQAKDWSTADRIRDQLQDAGWTTKDRKDGYELEKI